MTLGERQQVKKSLKLSVLDGSAFAAMLGLTQSYITPFALALSVTTAQIGLLASFPGFSTAISQLAAPDLTEKAGSRKAFILPMVLMHALMWLPIGLIPFVLHQSQVWWLIAFVTISSIFGAIANPAWGSMMAEPRARPFAGKVFRLAEPDCRLYHPDFFFCCRRNITDFQRQCPGGLRYYFWRCGYMPFYFFIFS